MLSTAGRRRIVIYRLGSLGDTVIAVPFSHEVVAAVRDLVPQAQACA